MLDWLIMLKTIKNGSVRPSFVSQKIYNKNVVAIHKLKPV